MGPSLVPFLEFMVGRCLKEVTIAFGRSDFNRGDIMRIGDVIRPAAGTLTRLTIMTDGGAGATGLQNNQQWTAMEIVESLANDLTSLTALNFRPAPSSINPVSVSSVLASVHNWI